MRYSPTNLMDRLQEPAKIIQAPRYRHFIPQKRGEPIRYINDNVTPHIGSDQFKSLRT